MPRIPTNGISTHYQQTGEGPDVVLIHAFTSNQAVWVLTNIVEYLAAEFRVTTYDLRGHGASQVVPQGYTSFNLAHDFQALQSTLGLRQPYVVGHSFGGVVAMHAARLFPESVSGIILSDTYFPGLRHLEPQMGQAGPWQELRSNWLKAGVDIGEEVDFERLFGIVAGFDDGQREMMKRTLGPPGYRWLSQISQLAGTSAAREAFEEAGLDAREICSIRHPVVALYDELSPFSATCEFLKQQLPNCAVEIVPGANHLAPVQNPAVFSSLVRQHLHNLVRACTS